MPRKPRIDIPGVYQHVMARGIDGYKICRSPKDYKTFLKILAEILLSYKDTYLMAWSLMSNHFHLLIFINKTPLSHIMRRLLTRYALYFNKTHKRKGHLFQNRYKSILCQTDEYLLELVRYIHLNPLKAGIAPTLDELDQYAYTGHRALLGKDAHPWQNTQEILKHFSHDPRKYRTFIKEGLTKVLNLDAGGLHKTLEADGQTVESYKRSSKNQSELFDDRILGRGDFVEKVLEQIESPTHDYFKKKPLCQIIDETVKQQNVTKTLLIQKTPQAMKIKQAIIEDAILNHKYTTTEVSRNLGIHQSNVTRILAVITKERIA